MPSAALTPNLRYAVAGGVPVFLDIARDRYFALPTQIATAFLELMDGAPTSAASRHTIADLLGISEFEPPFASAVVGSDLISANSNLEFTERPSWRATAGAIAEILSFKAQIAFLGLRGVLRRVVASRRKVTVATPGALARIAAAHRRADRWLSSYADCLTRATALSTGLSRAGVTNSLVIGVKTTPFGAHSWVQIDDSVVNDRVERVLPFTPILAL